jgi:formylglycine-generating enzyme required for sulfatase activity
MVLVSWYQVAEYCNRLSARDGIDQREWCYEPNGDGQYASGMKFWPQRKGYRLPTQAEWEHACRAGAKTRFGFGDAEELLAKYGWYVGNSLSKLHSVGKLRPNDWGLFDMHGNAAEWTGDVYQPVGKQDNRAQQWEVIETGNSRVWRSGSFLNQANGVDVVFRSRTSPSQGNIAIGFRPAHMLGASEQ